MLKGRASRSIRQGQEDWKGTGRKGEGRPDPGLIPRRMARSIVIKGRQWRSKVLRWTKESRGEIGSAKWHLDFHHIASVRFFLSLLFVKYLPAVPVSCSQCII